jgi:hypothetical protein
MRITPCKSPWRLAIILAIFWGVITVCAQDSKRMPATANATASTAPAAQAKGKNQTPPPGKMRGTTNEMRWAAATRTADRKAKAHAKGHKTNQAGVNQ